MTGLDAARLVGLLADPDRRLVVAALVLGATTLDEVMSRTALDQRAAVTALTRLVDGGLVDRAEDEYLLLEAAFAVAARQTAASPPSEHPDAPPDHARVLDAAFSDGRLVRLPAKQSKRVIVLDHIAQAFEPGVRYSERQVNATLSAIHADTATIRRYLVDHGFMDRADGEYWRSGGSV